jgi:hypothetical protein
MPFVDGTKEASMKKLLLIGAATLLLTSLAPDNASAQRSGGPGFRGGGIGMGGGGGVRGGTIGGGGFRGGIGGAGFRGGVVGGGFRGAAFNRGGFRGPVIGSGVRVAGFRGDGRGWRGWGLPIAAGLGLGLGWGYYNYPYAGYAASSYYGDACLAWTGSNWVDICY